MEFSPVCRQTTRVAFLNLAYEVLRVSPAQEMVAPRFHRAAICPVRDPKISSVDRRGDSGGVAMLSWAFVFVIIISFVTGTMSRRPVV